MALGVLRAEFQKSKFLYNYHDDRVFFSSHWKMPHIVFVGIRVLLALYSMYALTHYLVLYSLIVEVKKNIMVYFTTWSYVFLTAHMVLAALLSIICYKHVSYERRLKVDTTAHEIYRRKRQSDEIEIDSLLKDQPPEGANVEKSQSVNFNDSPPVKSVPSCEKGESDSKINTRKSSSGNPIPLPEYLKCFFKMSWVLSDMQLGAAPVVTSIYFTAIYPYIKNKSNVDLQDLNVHILNLVFVAVDFALGARPVRILHSWVPVLYGVVWCLFSLLYWSADHANHVVYKFIDWNTPASTMAWVGGLAVGKIIFMFFYFAMYRLKIWLYSIIHKEEYYVITDEDQ